MPGLYQIGHLEKRRACRSTQFLVACGTGLRDRNRLLSEREPTRFFMHLLDTIENEQKKTDVPSFKVGDSVRVHTKVIEGDKERVQIFTGIVIGRKGTGVNENFTVRRISYGEGVERVFPIHSPRIAKIEVEKAGTARRAKLNYLRGRKGKQAMAVREAK